VYIYDLSAKFLVRSSKGLFLTAIKGKAKYCYCVFVLHIPQKKLATGLARFDVN
jgi:hypothetical protein